MLCACILLPQLALDSVLRRVPDPEKPLALVTGPAHLRSLHAVNASAAQAGLTAGMRLSAAHALLADVATVEYDAQAEARWHRFLAAWAYRHSSLVSAQWPECVVLEARSSFQLLGPWPRFEARLREELTALGFTHRMPSRQHRARRACWPDWRRHGGTSAPRCRHACEGAVAPRRIA